ncbi:MAG: DUF2202 domain-containing protein [Chloroflexota bacterium]|nr:DUF2202 domain-containing protein [Chloroflexota bacterium]
MKKNILTFTLILVAIFLAACSTSATSPEEIQSIDTVAASEIEEPTEIPLEIQENLDELTEDESPEPPVDLNVGDLSADEVAGMAFMREEEKLARDVYLTMYELWGLPIFQNIADAEATHMETVKILMDRYGLEDPAEDQGVGVFTNPDLQSLYDQLIDLGSQSRIEAIKVGIAIEEIDILDLEEYIAQTDKADIQQVYENLLKGSRNHLRSFAQMFEKQADEVYQPQYLSQEAYDAIVNSDIETGRQGGKP